MSSIVAVLSTTGAEGSERNDCYEMYEMCGVTSAVMTGQGPTSEEEARCGPV
jgi:hypothetical protein